jgi:hypothetical protein
VPVIGFLVCRIVSGAAREPVNRVCWTGLLAALFLLAQGTES